MNSVCPYGASLPISSVVTGVGMECLVLTVEFVCAISIARTENSVGISVRESLSIHTTYSIASLAVRD